jgi:hypothetical protein
MKFPLALPVGYRHLPIPPFRPPALATAFTSQSIPSSWGSNAHDCRVADRSSFNTGAICLTGFRTVRKPQPN